jgi:hypothetical protein
LISLVFYITSNLDYSFRDYEHLLGDNLKLINTPDHELDLEENVD